MAINCCNILKPFIPNNGYFPISCANIDCSSYTPTCFTPTNNTLCGYLQGIDNALCSISVCPIDCSCITMSGTYPCIPKPFGGGNTLCDWANNVNNAFCTVYTAIGSLEGSGNVGGNGSPTEGSFWSGSVTGTGVTGTATLTGTTAVQHSLTGLVGGRGAALITGTGSGTAVVSQSTTIDVTDPVYEASAWIYIAAPTSGTVIIYNTWTGVETPQQLTTFTSAGALTGKWYQIKTWFVPTSIETVTISITLDGLSLSDEIYITDWIIVPLSQHQNQGVLEPYHIQLFSDTNNAGQYLGDSFVASGGGVSSTALAVTIADAEIVSEGKFFFGLSATVNAADNTTNYLYYSTVYEGYKITQQAYGDDGDILLWTIVTSGGVVTGSTQDFVTAPISNTYLQPLSIATGNIQNNAITDAKLSSTGVSAATYGNATHVPVFAVTTAGRITSVTSTAITFPVTTVNGASGAVSIGLKNLNVGANADVLLTSPANKDLLQYNGTKWVNTSLASFLSNIPTYDGTPANNYITLWDSATQITGLVNYQYGTFGSGNFGIGVGDISGSVINALSAVGSYNGYYGIQVTNSFATASNNAISAIGLFNDASQNTFLYTTSSNYAVGGIQQPNQSILESSAATNGILLNTKGGTFPIYFGVNSVLAATIDGHKRLVMASGAITMSVQYVTPVAAATVTSNGAQQMELNPAGTLATLTIVMPPSPVNGQLFSLNSSQVVTALTVTGTLQTTLTALAANTSYKWYYSTNQSLWVVY